jgi:hypothetical protein
LNLFMRAGAMHSLSRSGLPDFSQHKELPECGPEHGFS